MKVTIIGAEGKMGVWLRNHLKNLGHSIVSFDERKGDSPKVLNYADIVIVSVPVSKTAEVIRNSLRYMRKGSTIVEISSLKTGIHCEMVKAAGYGFTAMSLHPLFGPSVKNLKEKTVAVVPVFDTNRELSLASELFPEASMVEVEPEKHDRLMVHILSLPYLVNLALAATMGEADLELLKRLSGTSFALQYTLVQSVAGETMSLIYALLSENRYLEKTTETLISNIREIMHATGF